MKNSTLSILCLFFPFFVSANQIGVTSNIQSQPILHAVNTSEIPRSAHARFIRYSASTEVLHIAIALRPRNLTGLKAFVNAVSDPKSPQFHHFLKPAQVGNRFGATLYNVSLVTSFLKSNQIKIDLVAKNRMVILAEGSVAHLDHAFHTTIAEYSGFDSSGKPILFRAVATPVLLPSRITPIVQFVDGLSNFVRPKPQTTLTPNQARVLYGTAPFYSNGVQGQGVSVGISNWEPFQLSDIIGFINTYSLATPTSGAGTNIIQVSVNGADNEGSPSAEGDLDPEMVLSSAPLATIYIYDGSNSNPSPLATYTLEANDNLASIISESYGWNFSPATYANSLDDEILTMNAQGQTYCGSSGDAGTSEIALYPWPEIDPNILAVGGTYTAVDSSGNRTGELAWSGSGGGWLPSSYGSPNLNTLPSWQVGTTVPTDEPYRLIPDISLQAWSPSNGFYFYYNGGLASVSGTSCSSPWFAGGLATVEQSLAANGQTSRFGRINDLIYAQNGRSDVWYDVVGGSNGTLPDGTTSNAIAGWDYATGWGDPDFSALYTSLAYQYILPASFSVSPGIIHSGNLDSLLSVDSNYLVVYPGITASSTEPPIQVTVNGVSPLSHPGVLKLDVTGHTVDHLQEQILLYNWTTNTFDAVSTTTSSASDSTVEVNVSNIGNYVQSGTNALRAKITYIQAGPIPSYPFILDLNQVQWKAIP